MSIQKPLLEQLGKTLVGQFRANIAPMRASGRTMDSIHAIATDDTLQVLALQQIGAAEYGRKPTSAGAEKGSPTLFEAIKEWAQIRGIVTNINDRKQLGIVYAITKHIHKNGWKTKLDRPLSSVTDNLDLDAILKPLVVFQVSQFESGIIKELRK
jgi:hypothetical protein